MKVNYIVLAIPVFLFLIGIEFFYSQIKRLSLYRLDDFISNISTGTLEQLFCIFIRVLLFIPYLYLYQTLRLFDVASTSVLMWITAWLLSDFFYYWLHRGAHRITFFWAGHSVHHQSEHYNLSVALRQGILQTLIGWVFYLPMAIIGIPPLMFAAVTGLNTLYQFWIHTTTIKQLGWLEKIINTPSHHRVHHGKNPQYIDKNYAGSLMIWDKLFGTFEKENEKVDYGVTEPLDSWNPFYANIKVLLDTWYYSQPLKKLSTRLLCFIHPPEWVVNQIGQRMYEELKRPLPQTTHALPRNYLFINISLLIILGTYFLFHFDLHNLHTMRMTPFLFLTLALLGYVLNGGTHLFWLESARTISLTALLWQVIPDHFLLLFGILCFLMINVVSFKKFGMAFSK